MQALNAILDLPPIVRAFALAASLACAFSAASLIRRSFASLRWPTAEGTIHASEARPGSDSYGHHVMYSYRVAGKTYISSRVTLGGLRQSEHPHGLVEDVAAFRPGASTRVYYDPARPYIAVLQPGPQLGHVAMLLFAITFAIAMAWRWVAG